MPSGAQEVDPERYRLSRLLGRGGNAEVYLARDLTLGREVAIKFLSSEPGDLAWRRLLHEAQSAASLDHPNICTVYEVGETADGRGFIVMQYVEGETLAARLVRGALPVREALTLCGEVADALSAAHRRGIVHRDLKPHNIIVTPSGRPKLVDFGLARGLPFAPRGDALTQSLETVAGVLEGTPAYMSPEQIAQRPIDGRSDLFALGAVLFECLTGRRAFRGADLYDTISQILHVHPPAASTVRTELDERHDELCRRLLAKDPDDRFQSADEVLGAVRLLNADSSRSSTGRDQFPDRSGRETPGPDRRRSVAWRWAPVGAAVVVAAAIGLAAWLWMAPPPLPPVPPEAARWYERGAEAVREGAYRSGQLALEEAIRLHATYPLAHARLAEAFAELDEERAAQEQLLRLASLVPDESRLPDDEQMRVAGIRALVLRDLDASVAIYRQLTERRPRDATAWFDLGRAQESAGTLDAALASYERARTLDPQFAAAHLRIGSIHANELQTREALASFGEAERLYRSAANTEGEAEVLLRRGSLYDALNKLKEARTDLDRALSLARTLKNTHQMVRAQLALSSVTASEGRLAESSQLASAAVETALSMGLDSVAAAGLVDLAATLQSSHVTEAAAQAERALELAERRGARRTAARARLQLAAVRNEQQRPRDAVTLATQALAFLQPNRYRRYEFYGLLILSRAYEQLGDLERARAASADVLAATEALGHEGQVGLALSNLASLATALGRLPEALTLRERAERIRRAQRDASALPYDLANRADLLIRLGRLEEAREPLGELEAGIDAGIETYVGRARRVTFLRGFSAVVACRNDEAATILGRLMPFESDGTSVGLLAPAVYEYALAHARRGPARGRAPSSSRDADAESVVARERQYWLAAAALGRGDARAALAGAEHGLELLGTVPNDELRWRLAAVGAAAAAQLRDGPAAASLQARMTRALEQLRASWPGGLGTYERRPDLVELRTRVGK